MPPCRRWPSPSPSITVSRNAERIGRDRDRALKTLNALSDPLVTELTRRAGSRAQTDSTEERGPKAKGAHSDPTLASVVRSMSKSQVPDPVFDAVKELAQLVSEMAQLALRIDDKVRFVTDTRKRAKESQIANCKVCEREVACTPADRLRSGMCQACYAASRREYRAGFYVQVSANEITTFHSP